MSTQNSRGFTLIELIIILVIIGVMGAVASRVIGETIEHRRFRASLSEMELLRTAIIGDPELKSAGVRIDFGFVGDIGKFPTSLRELVENYNYPPLPPWSVTTGIGWQGPYLERGIAPDDFLRDGWGNDYIYSNTTGVITSLGSDGELGGAGYEADFSTEDLTSPLDRRIGTLRVVVTDVLGNPLIDGAPFAPPGVVDVRVRIYFPCNGARIYREDETDGDGVYHFTNIPAGNRSLMAIVDVDGAGPIAPIPSPLKKAVVISGVGSRHDIRVVGAVDAIAPEPPTGLSAEGVPFGDIKLSWTPPTLNTDGTHLVDLAGFNIYRQTTPFTLIYPPTDANRIATVGLVRHFRDRVVSSHHHYYYIVRAFDVARNESPPPNEHPPLFEIVRASTANVRPVNGIIGYIRNVARATTHYGEEPAISVWIRRGTFPDTVVGGVRHSEDPDGVENLVVEYRNNVGSWITLETFPGDAPVPGGAPGEIFERTYPLPADALHTGFRLRFHQLAGSGSTYDWWHIDDVNVAGVFSDNFDDGTLVPDWTVTFPPPTPPGVAGVGAHIFSSPPHSMFTRSDSVAVTSRAIDLSDLPPTRGSFVILGIRNFFNAGITVSRIRVSWTGGAPNTFSGAPGIWTRIPTAAVPLRKDSPATENREIAILDPSFILGAHAEGILYIGFDREMPEGTAIIIVLNPGAGAPAESTFEVIW